MGPVDVSPPVVVRVPEVPQDWVVAPEAREEVPVVPVVVDVSVVVRARASP